METLVGYVKQNSKICHISGAQTPYNGQESYHHVIQESNSELTSICGYNFINIPHLCKKVNGQKLCWVFYTSGDVEVKFRQVR